MPRGDRTGPWGNGPKTGRAAGYCAGSPVPGYANPDDSAEELPAWHGVPGGWGRGRRNRYYATGLTRNQRWQSGFPTRPPAVPGAGKDPKDELEALRQEVEDCQGRITAACQHIEELKER